MAPVESLLIEESFVEKKVDTMEKSDRKNSAPVTSIKKVTSRMGKYESLESIELKSLNTESRKRDEGTSSDKIPASPKDWKQKQKYTKSESFSIPEVLSELSDESYDEQEESTSPSTSTSTSMSTSTSTSTSTLTSTPTSGRLFPRESTALEQMLEKALSKSSIDETLDHDEEPASFLTLAPLPRGSLTMQQVFEEVKIALHSSANEEGVEEEKSTQSSQSQSPPSYDRHPTIDQDDKATVTPSMYFMDANPISVQAPGHTSRKISWADEKGLALTSQCQSRPKNSSTNNSMSKSSLAL